LDRNADSPAVSSRNYPPARPPATLFNHIEPPEGVTLHPGAAREIVSPPPGGEPLLLLEEIPVLKYGAWGLYGHNNVGILNEGGAVSS